VARYYFCIIFDAHVTQITNHEYLDGHFDHRPGAVLTLLVDAISKKSLAENPLIKERLDAGLHNYEYRAQIN